MKSKDQLLLEEAYRQIHQTRWFRFNNVDPVFAMGVLGQMDGVELEPDYEYEGQEEFTSGTIMIDIDEFPEVYKKLLQYAKEGKIKAVGGFGTKDMTGRATRVKIK